MSTQKNDKSTPAVASSEGPWTFKSKYRRDQVTFKKMIMDTLPDGSKRVIGTKFVEFDHNTFTTRDPEVAKYLREAIAERIKLGVPMNVYEVTA